MSPPDRPIYYSILLYAMHWGRTLWPVTIVQAAITIAVLAIFLHAALGRIPRLHMAIFLTAVAALTALPLLVSEIMPDIFTPLLVVSMLTLGLYSSGLTAEKKLFLHSVVLAGTCVHQANWLLAVAVLICLCLVRCQPKPARVPVSITVCAGLVFLIIPNAIRYRTIAITRGSGVFLLAKLMEDRIVLDYLDEACKSNGWSICGQAEKIRRYRNAHAKNGMDEFIIWGGLLDAAGGWDTVSKYALSIDTVCLARHPVKFLATSIYDFGRQLVQLSSGDGIQRYSEHSGVTQVLKKLFPATVHEQFQGSRQQAGSFGLQSLAVFHVSVVLFAVALLMSFGMMTLRVDPKLFAAISILLCAVAANAFVMGALSEVHDRYQSRVAWLIVLAAMILVYRHFRRFLSII